MIALPKRFSRASSLLQVKQALALALAFDLDLPRRKAERRFCAVGNPAWMPG
jgi:hypothetical protein